MNPKISILLVNYNNDQQVGRALDHIVNQTMQPYEVIVCDDGSTDNSVKIIQQYCSKYNYIKLLKNTENKGIIYSFNNMVTHANGDYILGSASDDLLLPDFIETYTTIIHQHPHTKIFYSDTFTFGSSNSIDYYKKTVDEKNIKNKKLTNYNLIKVMDGKEFADIFDKKYECISTNTAVMEKSALLEAGVYDENLKWHCDWFLAYCIALRYESVKINQILTLYNFNDSSSYSKNMNNDSKQIEVIKNIISKLNEKEFHDIRKIFSEKPLLLSMFNPKHMFKVLIKHPRYYKYFFKSKIIFINLPLTYIHKLLFIIKSKTPGIYYVLRKSYRHIRGRAQ